MACDAISESVATAGDRLDHPVPSAPEQERTDFVWRNEAFRKGSLKSLISLMASNQPFRGIVSFQGPSRRFVSFRRFRTFGRAGLATAPFQVQPAHHLAGSSEKEKLLSVGKRTPPSPEHDRGTLGMASAKTCVRTFRRASAPGRARAHFRSIS